MFDLDQLLGRASLKERIDELEDENERLRERYEAEADRRAEATTAKQEADREINRLEDRIAQLEGELERTREDEAGPAFRRRDRIRGAELDAVLDRLESVRTGPEGALTAVFADGDDLRSLEDGDIDSILGDRLTLLEDATPCLCCLDDAGLVAVALEPPVRPALDPAWDDRFRLEREWFRPTGRHVLALVRTDVFAVGVYDGDERIDYRGFESDVKGSHSKGGFSQARFERIRDEQIDDHLERAADALASTLADVEEGRLFLTGQRGVLETLAEESGLEPDATAAVDATGDPESALADARRSFWTTDLYVL
ncbi:Vms1/Ankzf1 family peptidyl-tRNA hydrolase [Halopiger goleimassiliensis]|uniref:Vms1/Ankzf1 family peptidyl-tRNA hydrolase n=1 Tax=Halopiger goleimassiliensis TaxID=1293048 RepID=UPI0006775953|nr:Vms1/Ankzf1 family peptidyl-tRNA hydrolase [Halopiger goleimassiliensis]